MIISVAVRPGSKDNALIQVTHNYYEAKIQALPVGGKANLALIELLAKEFKVTKSQINLKLGSKSRLKLFEIVTK